MRRLWRRVVRSRPIEGRSADRAVWTAKNLCVWGRARYCGSLVDYGCCKTMRKTVPLHVAKRGGGHLQVARAIEDEDIEKGAAQPLRFPSEGRSLNSRGFSNPRYSARRAKTV